MVYGGCTHTYRWVCHKVQLKRNWRTTLSRGWDLNPTLNLTAASLSQLSRCHFELNKFAVFILVTKQYRLIGTQAAHMVHSHDRFTYDWFTWPIHMTYSNVTWWFKWLIHMHGWLRCFMADFSDWFQWLIHMTETHDCLAWLNHMAASHGRITWLIPTVEACTGMLHITDCVTDL